RRARRAGPRVEGVGKRWSLDLWELHLSVLVELRRREASGIHVLADAVEVLARIAVAREAPELGVDRVPRPDLDLAVVDPRVEAVERAHRRTASDRAHEVVDTAVARADEARRRLHIAHWAAEVHAAGGDLDELVGRAGRQVRRVRRLVDLGVARPHVDGRLVDLADA